ncbi:MAG TPA: hypothetical protein VFL93_16315 [Longimicrobiaceae bacterium]|nr:hypothetical protein [Longimicrobiaceae bacterium]
MILQPSIPLRLVDARDLGEACREVLRPGELVTDAEGRLRRLPRYFYEITSWEQALQTQLTEHFGLWELIDVDVREAPALRDFPRYVPCAIALLAAHLELFRLAVGTVVRVAANGGYRSPGHALNPSASAHSWGTAANLYRIGDELLDTRERIEKYSRTARRVLPGIWARPYGSGPGCADDHVHLDIGYATVVPHDAPSEGGEAK